MKRLSSRITAAMKIYIPTCWFGTLGLMMLMGMSGRLGEPPEPVAVVLFIVVPAAMALIGYVFMKKLLFNLVNEVYDEGASLLFKNGGVEARVSFKDVKNISYFLISSPQRITVSLRKEGPLGRDLSFIPPAKLNPLRRDPNIESLIDRVDAARCCGPEARFTENSRCA